MQLPRLQLAAIALALALVWSAGAARADDNPPCTPPPNTSNLIVCFGNTPCPAGYVDPVGIRQRNIAGESGFLNAMQPTQKERWICQQLSPSEEASSDAGSGNPATTPAATPAPAAAAAPGTTTAGPPAGSAGSQGSAPAPLAAASTTLAVANSVNSGRILVDSGGMTLYTRTADPLNGSSCSGTCTVIYVPLQPPIGSITVTNDVTGVVGEINRDDGTQQLTYNSQALYTYTGDLQPGDVNGGIAGAYQPAMP